MRILVMVALLSALALVVDYYVYRNWRRFALSRPALRWTLSAVFVGMVFMPVTILAYGALSYAGVIGAGLVRQLLIGLWVVWYVPKALLALVVVLKDAARFVNWLFGWLQVRLGIDEPEKSGSDLTDLPRMSRKEFVQKVGWTAATAPFAVVGYGVFRGLYDFDVRHVTVPITDLPRGLHGLRIAQLSDLHAGSMFSERPMEEVVNLVLGQRPDLVAITGDFVNHDHREAPLILPALSRLVAPLGVYGVRGNHDHYAHVGRVSELVREAGIDLLVNDARTLTIDGARLHLIGTDNTGLGQNFGDLSRAVSRTQPNGDDARLLLAHDPTFWDSHVRREAAEIDLMLSGHTHGGQFGFEVGPLRWSLARMAYTRWAGLYTERRDRGHHHLYVNRGIGTVGAPVRFGIRPEITILTLVRATEPATLAA